MLVTLERGLRRFAKLWLQMDVGLLLYDTVLRLPLRGMCGNRLAPVKL